MTTAALPILYSFRRCPYAMRARMALSLTRCRVELREVVLKDKPASMLALSPKGTVPILVLANGEVIDESLDIIDWAIAQNNKVISPPSGAQQLLIARNDLEFKAALDRYKYFDRYPEHSQQHYRQQSEKFLGALERQLSRQRLVTATRDSSDDAVLFDEERQSEQPACAVDIFLYGDRLGYADIAIFPFVRQFSHVDKTWFEQADYPNLRHWLNYFLEHDDFLTVMTKFSPWQPQQPAVVFPA